MNYLRKTVKRVRNDANFSRVKPGVVRGVRGTRRGAGRYLANKIPIVQWLPAYVPKWLLSDMIAGLSVGLLLIPQAVIYSFVAGVSIQQSLLASWLPGIIYTIMGTSRDISVGPTSTTAFLTGEIVLQLAKSNVPAPFAAGAVSFCVGIWSLLFGVLNLGFIFDFISVPMAIGFTMGLSFVVTALQLPVLLGLTGILPTIAAVPPGILKQLNNIKPITVAIGGTSILILAVLQYALSKWGHRSAALRLICNGRHIFVLITYTSISYLINKDRAQPLWINLGLIETTIASPTILRLSLIQNLLPSSVILFISISIEHVALAKSFGNEQYSINQSQELFSLGLTNVINSFFGAPPVGGGDMARSSVLAGSGVRTPLASLVTSATVLIGMYNLSPFLQYVPQATVAAITIVSVIGKQPANAIQTKYWRLSFVDFVQFFLAMQFTLMAGSLIGLGLPVVFMIFYTILRTMFSRPLEVKEGDLETSYSTVTPPWWGPKELIPAGTQVIKLETDCIFLNAERIKRHVLDKVFTNQIGDPSLGASPADRPWNLRLEKHIRDLRNKAGVSEVDNFIPSLRVVILDFSSTSFIDASGIGAIQEIKKTLLGYGGAYVEFRFVGLCPHVKRRFERAKWPLLNPYEEIARITINVDSEDAIAEVLERKDLVFEHLPHAIGYNGSVGRELPSFEFGFETVDLTMSKLE